MYPSTFAPTSIFYGFIYKNIEKRYLFIIKTKNKLENESKTFQICRKKLGANNSPDSWQSSNSKSVVSGFAVREMLEFINGCFSKEKRALNHCWHVSFRPIMVCYFGPIFLQVAHL